MKISLAIMAHPKRREAVRSLYRKIKNMGFSQCRMVWDEYDNEWITGAGALRSHDNSDYHIVLQDDAIISEHFYKNVAAALSNVPERSLVSLYTGRVRPYPFAVSKAVNGARSLKASWLKAPTLLWGVGIAVPTEDIEAILRHETDMKYDRRVGLHYKLNKRPVYYTYPSLVDHNYKLGSLIGNDYEREPRRAHLYESSEVKEWNQSVIPIEVRI